MVRRTVSSRWGIAALLALGLTAWLPGAPTSADVAIVVNPRVPITDLSFTELRRILLGERQFWSSSLRISLLMRAPVAREREVLLNTVYEMSEAQVRQYWISKVFRAEAASAPPLFYSDEEILQALASVPGSIAAVEVSRIPKSLRVVRIDGHLPGEAGYRLR